MTCNQCPRECNAQRDIKPGFCGVSDKFTIARAAPHFWEEPCISGTKGSGTVFFSGCGLRCVFCQNYQISTGCYGAEVSEELLIQIFKNLVDKGVHNINLVNPTHYALQLAKLFSHYKPPVPVVYNSSGYEKVETLKALEGMIDVYLPDLKYIYSAAANNYSGAENYFDYAAPALLEMRRQTGDDVFDDDGIMTKGMIVRHLILPKNTRNSIAVLDWLNCNMHGTRVSLMAQYTPCGKASLFPELSRKVTKREYDKVLSAMLEMGFDNAYVQELDSSDNRYIPPFDLTGVL